MLYRTSDVIQPWDLQIEIGSKIFDTRPLVLADLQKIQELPRMEAADQYAFIRSLFKGELPPIDENNPEMASVVMNVIGQYTKIRAEKNSAAIAASVAAAMASSTSLQSSSH